jgi:hypothetical protein
MIHSMSRHPIKLFFAFSYVLSALLVSTAFPVKVHAIPLTGQAISSTDQLVLGEISLDWKVTNSSEPDWDYGYIFGEENIEFTFPTEGFWPGTNYLSYDGLDSIDEFVDPEQYAWLPSVIDGDYLTITFAEKDNDDYRGIFIGRSGDVYFAIDPIEIQDGLLTFDWWYDFFIIPGDINNSKGVDLQDVVLCLETLTLKDQTEPVIVEADVDFDDKIGIIESIFVLQQLSK